MKKLFHIFILTLLAMAGVQTAWANDPAGTAVAPFAQVIPGGPSANGFFTFMAFTHPSLATATSQVGVTVSYEGPADSLLEPSGQRSVSFNINAGELHKVFIVASNHPTVNPTTFPGNFTARDHFLVTTSSTFTSGNIRIRSKNIANNTVNTTPSVSPNSDGKFNNLNQISMWGAIFSEGTNAGFAMEFMGDLHDSTAIVGSGGVINSRSGSGMN